VNESYGTQLPPVPDRATGLPRPPAAPTSDSIGRSATPIDRRPHRHPAGPTVDHGPVLEWNQLSAWFASKVIGVLVLIVVGVISLTQHGLAWTTSAWQAWVGIAVPAFAMWVSIRRDWLAAGALWVQNRRAWVALYELTRVEFQERVLLGWGQVDRPVILRLQDSAGRSVMLRLRAVQANPRMWDLVYNGILHSVASGTCDISPKAYFGLGFPLRIGTPGTPERAEFPSITLISRFAVLVLMGLAGAVVAVASIYRHEYRFVALGVGIGVFGMAMAAFVVWLYRDAKAGVPDRPVDRHPLAGPLLFAVVLMTLMGGVLPFALQEHAYPVVVCGVFVVLFVPYMTWRTIWSRRHRDHPGKTPAGRGENLTGPPR